MRLKVLIVAAILAISFGGVYMPKAMAADGITPWLMLQYWAGFVYKDKYGLNQFPQSPYGTSGNSVIASGKSVGEQGQKAFYFDQDFAHVTSFGFNGEKNGVKFSTMLGMQPFPGGVNDHTKISWCIATISYQFSDVNLLVGRNPVPWSAVDIDAVANSAGMIKFDADCGFVPQIKVDYKGLYVMAMRPNPNTPITGMTTSPETGAASGYFVDTANSKCVIPFMAAGYVYGNPFTTPMSFNVAAAYQTFTLKKTDTSIAALDGKRINTYVVVGSFNMNAGMIGFGAHAFYGINPGVVFVADAGLIGLNNNLPVVNDAQDGIEDTKQLAGHAKVSFNFGQTALVLGVGYSTVSNSQFDKDDQRMEYYVTLKYNLQPNYTIAPSVDLCDEMKDVNGKKEGKTWRMGVMFIAML